MLLVSIMITSRDPDKLFSIAELQITSLNDLIDLDDEIIEARASHGNGVSSDGTRGETLVW